MKIDNKPKPLNISKIREDFFLRLSKFIDTPELYIDFPPVPSLIIDLYNTGNLEQISIYKKGASYHMVVDGKGDYIETLDPLSIVPDFSPSEAELSCEHYGVKVRQLSLDILMTDSEATDYESYIHTIVYDRADIVLPEEISMKISELRGDVPPKDMMFESDSACITPKMYWLYQITLIRKGEIFVVLDSDIHFTRQELEHIKKELS